MSEPMTSPGDKQPPKDWWLENACRITVFRLHQQRYISANRVRDCVEFAMTVTTSVNYELHPVRA